MFMVKCPNRNKETLIRIICENVADGSTIYTDGWKAYRTLGEINGYNVNINHQLKLSINTELHCSLIG